MISSLNSFLQNMHISGLDETLVSVSISGISWSKFLVSVSKICFLDFSSRSRKFVFENSRSRLGLKRPFYVILGLVLVSQNCFLKVSSPPYIWLLLGRGRVCLNLKIFLETKHSSRCKTVVSELQLNNTWTIGEKTETHNTFKTQKQF